MRPPRGRGPTRSAGSPRSDPGGHGEHRQPLALEDQLDPGEVVILAHHHDPPEAASAADGCAVAAEAKVFAPSGSRTIATTARRGLREPRHGLCLVHAVGAGPPRHYQVLHAMFEAKPRCRSATGTSGPRSRSHRRSRGHRGSRPPWRPRWRGNPCGRRCDVRRDEQEEWMGTSAACRNTGKRGRGKLGESPMSRRGGWRARGRPERYRKRRGDAPGVEEQVVTG